MAALRLVATSFMVTGQSDVGTEIVVLQVSGFMPRAVTALRTTRLAGVLTGLEGVGEAVATGDAVTVGVWMVGFSACAVVDPMANTAMRPRAITTSP